MAANLLAHCSCMAAARIFSPLLWPALVLATAPSHPLAYKMRRGRCGRRRKPTRSLCPSCAGCEGYCTSTALVYDVLSLSTKETGSGNLSEAIALHVRAVQGTSQVLRLCTRFPYDVLSLSTKDPGAVRCLKEPEGNREQCTRSSSPPESLHLYRKLCICKVAVHLSFAHSTQSGRDSASATSQILSSSTGSLAKYFSMYAVYWVYWVYDM
jgi:hypothetical protein